MWLSWIQDLLLPMQDELAEVLILLFDEKSKLAAFLERILSTEVLHFN